MAQNVVETVGSGMVAFCAKRRLDISEDQKERALLPSVFAHTRNLSWC